MYAHARPRVHNNIHILDICDNFSSVSGSGMDNSELLTGRPYGGCGILFRKCFSSSVWRLKNCSKRFCGLMLTLPDPISNHTSNILLIYAYFPADYGTSHSHNDFLDTVAELEGFLASHDYDNLILYGDFSIDFGGRGHNLDHFISFNV